MRWYLVLILALVRVDLNAADVSSWTNCPSACKCRWVSGRKMAECTNAGLTSVPTNLSSEIQALDVSYNTITSLSAQIFQNISLVNLQKLFLRHCAIENVDNQAFQGLHILIELDLSHNRIATISPLTFQENSRLRQLYLNHNSLQKLDDALFTNMTFLLNVDLSDCQLSHINRNTFDNVPKLNTINLNNNNFTTMRVDTFEKVPALVSLSLFDNSWNCDCRLKPFIEWTIRKNLYSRPTVCAQPEVLRGEFWTDLSSEDLSCRPRVEVPATIVDTAGANTTLSCKSSGNPVPDMHWVYNSRIITNSSQDVPIGSKYIVSESVDDVRWLNLTVLGLNEDDVGVYTCVAQSYGGMEESGVQLIMREITQAAGIGVLVVSGTGFSLESWTLVIGVAVGGAVALVLVISLLAYCCVRLRRRRRALAVKSIGGGRLANGDALLTEDGTNDEKFPLTTVNPVQKPPRRIDRLSVTSAGTELTEIKSSLLDGGSVYQPSSVCDSEDRLEGRSIDSGDMDTTKSQDGLDGGESVLSYAGRAYPPDLLPFSARPQPPQTTMPPHHHPYGTLPYSRSHSPLSMCSVPITRPQGYVTIPRRPRVPSWSSSGDPYFQKLVAPAYDNLGPRTTADGSSMLSLNKAGGGEAWSRVSPDGSNAKKVISDRENRHSVASMSSLGETREKVPPRPPPKPRKKSMDVVEGPLIEDEEDDGTEV